MSYEFLPASRAFALYVLCASLCLTCLTHAPYLRTLRALFGRVKIFLGWICTPAQTFHFPKAIEVLQTVLFLSGSKNSPETV